MGEMSVIDWIVANPGFSVTLENFEVVDGAVKMRVRYKKENVSLERVFKKEDYDEFGVTRLLDMIRDEIDVYLFSMERLLR